MLYHSILNDQRQLFWMKIPHVYILCSDLAMFWIEVLCGMSAFLIPFFLFCLCFTTIVPLSQLIWPVQPISHCLVLASHFVIGNCVASSLFVSICHILVIYCAKDIHPDITEMVDWALKNNYPPTYTKTNKNDTLLFEVKVSDIFVYWVVISSRLISRGTSDVQKRHLWF